MNNPDRPSVLVVDDEQASLNAIYRTLRKEFEVVLSLNAQSALEVLRSQEVAVILTDQRMPEMTGIELLKSARQIQPDALRILITGYADIEATIQAINEGQVFYYINKPWEPEELRLIIRRATEQYALRRENQRLLRELEIANQRLQAENVILHQEVEKQYVFENIIGNSPAMQKVFQLMKKVIPTDTTVLLTGETGTGKELIARAIHYNGLRKDNLFVAQNCAALPETLLESELFGHVKGAFTGATTDKKGLFDLANGGTIFLDEIGDTSPEMQKRLLRVLQEGEIHPVGSEKTIKVDVRIISATNQDLQKAVREGRFREDLFYRLNVFPIHLPALRERREDIPLLVNHFVEKYARKMGKKIEGITARALSKLMTEDFPGNVRQLENLIERAVTLADDGERIDLHLLDVGWDSREKKFGFGEYLLLSEEQSLKEVIAALEREMIQNTLKKFRGNVSQSARALGLSRLGLQKKLRRLQIKAEEYKQSLQ